MLTLEHNADIETEGLLSKYLFRYDSHYDGKLTFSVYRSAALYGTLLRLCPPAYDGQVRLVEDRLEISGAYPLLHCRKELKKMNESNIDPNIKKELKVMHHLYERNGHLLFA